MGLVQANRGKEEEVQLEEEKASQEEEQEEKEGCATICFCIKYGTGMGQQRKGGGEDKKVEHDIRGRSRKSFMLSSLPYSCFF